ncbi:MAG TPA: extensin family protein [Terriglobales bacterium]|nr:extensin family protein [Terriglobales bacterium]
MGQQQPDQYASIVSAAALCGFALLAALTWPFWWGRVEGWVSSMPMNPSPPAAPSGNQITETWTDNEIEAALVQCVRALGPINADATPLKPIRFGQCGTPAPVLVKSIGGGSDTVSFDPPLMLDCSMVSGLARWLKDSVQPAAKEIFSSPVAKIVGSSYACRNVYNLPDGKLSQHAFANAIDVPVFQLVDGTTIDVTDGWGPTQRDIAAASKAKKDVTSSIAPKKVEKGASRTPVVKVATAVPGGVDTDPTESNNANVELSQAAKFLRLVHDGGCSVFSTVLGPEANDVHRTHLHLDMQDRKVLVCE